MDATDVRPEPLERATALGADRTFHASQVLAKHDENYMPREVADRLKEKGEWRPDGPETRSSRPQADSAPTRL